MHGPAQPRADPAPQPDRARLGKKTVDTATWEEEERGGVASRALAEEEQAHSQLQSARPEGRPSSPAPGRVGLPLPLSFFEKYSSFLTKSTSHICSVFKGLENTQSPIELEMRH